MEPLLDRLALARFSSRNATEELRHLFVDFLRESRLDPGTRLATEAEMLTVLKLSRSTVRRALDPLEKDGWIDRIAGSGTYVGRRIRQLSASPAADQARRPSASEGRAVARVAVLIFRIGDLAHDWYTPRILQGLDDAGDAQRIAVELLGDRDGDPDALARRLELSRPDVLICLSNQPKHAFVIRDAQRMGIHCFVSGTPMAVLGLPGVSEDNRQAMTLAVDHLIGSGHQRIGLILPRVVEPWVFDRLEAYHTRMHAASLTPHVCWCDTSAVGPAACDAVDRFIRSAALTAVVPAHVAPMRCLDQLVASGTMRVPDDLSVVSFEQDHTDRAYLGHADATRIVFPLREMGQRLAAMARTAVDTAASPTAIITLPSELIPGTTVQTMIA